MQIGWTEVLLFAAAIVLLFGASRLPQLARSIGRSRKAFKDGMRDGEKEPDDTASRFKAGPLRPDLSSLSDEEILAEMQRRTGSKP